MIPVIFQKRLADSIPTPEVTYHPAIVPSCCKDIKEMKDVCLECLEFLMEHHQPTCKLIRAGRVQRQRHDDFKKSKKSRKALDFQCYSLRFFSEDQQDFAMRWLRKEFCKTGDTKHLDYILKFSSISQ